MLYILSWFFGIGAMLSLFFLYQQQSRRKLLTCKFCADVCWVFHYLCLGAVGGAIPNFVGIFRELVFVKREEKEWANHTAWPIGFIAVNFALGLASFRTPINLLPISASAAGHHFALAAKCRPDKAGFRSGICGFSFIRCFGRLVDRRRQRKHRHFVDIFFADTNA